MFSKYLDKRPQKKASSSKHISLGIPRRPLLSLSLSLSIVLCRRYKIAFRFYSYKKEEKNKERERSNEKKIDWLRDSWRNCTCQYWLPPSISLSLSDKSTHHFNQSHTQHSLSLSQTKLMKMASSRRDEIKFESHSLWQKSQNWSNCLIWFRLHPSQSGKWRRADIITLKQCDKSQINWSKL